MNNKFLHYLVILLVSTNIQTASAQSDSSSAVKDFFKTLLFCGPGDKMCDKNYNPNAANAMVESPEQLIQFLTQFDSYMSGRRESVVRQSRPISTDSPPPSTQVQSQQNSVQKTSIAVTAAPPSKLNPPLDNDSFQRILKSNSSLGATIQAYMQKKPESIPSLKLYAEGGDPFAQLFLGLAYTDDWTGLQNPYESCRWFRESATAGVSSARFFMAQRAYVRSPCFSQTPTLDQAKIWAELAAQSSDSSIKKDAQELIQEILRAQIAGSK